VQDLQAAGASGRRDDEVGDRGRTVLGLLAERLLDLGSLLRDILGMSTRSRDASSCSFIRARSWMFLAEYSISSSVTPQMPTSARVTRGSSSSRTAGRWSLGCRPA
jgi:hypothetical protein